MALKKADTPGKPIAGRKSAAIARNRLTLLLSTQEIVALRGSTVTIEEIAIHSDVSVSTIYQHFSSKELLIEAAVLSALNEWELWAFQFAPEIEDPLEKLVMPMRLLVRLKRTHPQYAQLVASVFGEIQKYLPGITAGYRKHVSDLIKNRVLKMDNPELRLQNFTASLLEAFRIQLQNPKANIAHADKAIEIALGMLNISPAKAKKIMSRKINL